MKGDIVLIPFPFTDLSGNKNRPAIVLVDSDDDVVVTFLTTQLSWLSEFDFIMQPSDLNGLKKTSLVRLNKLATIDKDLIIGRLGSLDRHYEDLLDRNLMRIFQISK
jgi:mRNA interferase MazF